MQAAIAEEEGFSSTRLGRIGEAFSRLQAEGKVAGAVSLIARRGRVTHFQTSGFMDLEARRPMDQDAIFRIASMTKPIVSVAAMMLFEEGRFLLDDPIADFLPEFSETKVFVRETSDGLEVSNLVRPITIRHVLTHTAGLAAENAQGPVGQLYTRERMGRNDETIGDKVRRLAALPLAHQPGDGWTYGDSTTVLGSLIEVISAQPLDRFLKQKIFEPLDMSDTDFFVPPEKYARLARVYTPGEGGVLQYREEVNSNISAPRVYKAARGGLVSTATDYARFCQMLLNGGCLDGQQILGRKTVELMTANQTGASRPFPPYPAFPAPNGYGFGLGFRVLLDPGQSDVPSSAGEYGWGGAYGTYFWIDPREQLYGILMAQLSPPDLRYGFLFQSLAYQALVA